MIKNISNKKIALAYSGGLDTSTSIKWLKNKNCLIYSLFVDLGDKTKKEIKKINRKSLLLGSKKFILLNCKEEMAKESLIALRTRSFNIYSGAGIYFNITPIGRSIIGTVIAKTMKKKKLNIWCDGSTYKGNDIQRFFIYSYRINKRIRFYKPWLDEEFINKIGGREEMNKYMKVKKKKYSVDSNLIGNTYEGMELENLNYNYTKNNFILSKKLNNVKKKTVLKITFKKGKIIKLNNKKIKKYYIFFKKLNNICSKHKLGISDQIEERIIGIKSRGIYESPSMFFLHCLYERMVSCSLDYKVIKMYRENGNYLGENLYSGLWYNHESKIRKKLGIEITKNITGYVKVAIIYNNIFFIDTKIKKSLYNKEICSMEKKNKLLFNSKDRLGQLNMLKVKII
ncbi:argininosuccinate synthase [Candidatus Vidania fulgoroideorum]